MKRCRMWLQCMKTAVFSLTHPISLHYRDDIYYLVVATILLHNVMVEERMSNDEVEDASFYNYNKICSNNDNDDECAEQVNLDSDGYDKTSANRHDKFKMVHKWWEDLYDYEGSKNLKDSMKRHLYSEMFGTDALSTAHRWMESYNPLSL